MVLIDNLSSFYFYSFPFRKQVINKRAFCILFGFASIIMLTSCQKYEEGPFLSFRSPEKRFKNTWQVDYAENLANAENITHKFTEQNYQLTIEDDNEFRLSFNAPATSRGLQQDAIEGRWQLIDDEVKVKWEFQGHDPYGFLGTNGETSVIIKLKKDELWMRNVAGNIEIHFEPM